MHGFRLLVCEVIEVAGWGIDTVASFEYYPKLNNNLSYVLDERPRFLPLMGTRLLLW